LPFLSTERIARLEKVAGRVPDNRPLVFVGRRDNALRLVATSVAARKLGLAPGLAFADARARVPNMRVETENEAADAALMGNLARWCDRYTPVLAFDPPDGLMMEISGSAHLFGGEQSLKSDLSARLERMGFTALTAIAKTTYAGRALCRFGTQDGPLESLPVEALEVGEKITLALYRAGLKSIADLASRPRKPLAARFGETLTLRLAQVLGEIDRPIVPLRVPDPFFAECRFADPIGLIEDIELALSRLCQQLCADLSMKDRGGRSFEVTFFRADGAVRSIEVRSGQPLRAPETLLKLITMRLDALPDALDPGFGFDMIRIAVRDEDSAAPIQPRLDGDNGDERSVIELVDRLAARFGPERVEKFVAKGSHLPERAVSTVSALEVGNTSWPAKSAMPPRPLFLFSPAEPIEVIAEVPDGPPRRFRWRGTIHETVHVEGPERIAPEWWRAKKDILTRDYFRVEDARGHRFWVFRYGLYGREAGPLRWFIHGLFP
jgi:protein ImuB